MKKLLGLAVVCSLMSVGISHALADVAPSGSQGYSEPCMIAKYKLEVNSSCTECQTSASASQTCSQLYAQAGYVWECNTCGVSQWTEIWCKPNPTDAGTATTADASATNSVTHAACPSDDKSGCAMSPRRSGSAMSLVLAGVAIAALRRRRRP